MRKFSILILLIILASDICYGQDISHSTVNINYNLPVIEKKEYIIKYRPVYIEKQQPKRVARKLPSPVCLLEYLWIYPEDLGTYTNGPQSIIDQINKQGKYGRNDWRVPTSDELRLMENYADMCGLGDDIYLSTSHRNGILRLVSSGMSIKEKDDATKLEIEKQRQAIVADSLRKAKDKIEQQNRINATHKAAIDKQKSIVSSGKAFFANQLLWASTNMGANDSYYKGVAYETINCPDGWRLPTEDEFRTLIKQSTKYQSYYRHSSGLIIPFGIYAINSNKKDAYIILPDLLINYGSSRKYIRVVQDKIF